MDEAELGGSTLCPRPHVDISWLSPKHIHRTANPWGIGLLQIDVYSYVPAALLGVEGSENLNQINCHPFFVFGGSSPSSGLERRRLCGGRLDPFDFNLSKEQPLGRGEEATRGKGHRYERNKDATCSSWPYY